MMDEEKTIPEEGEEAETPPSPQEKAEIEKLEELKLKSKFPGNVFLTIQSMYGYLLGHRGSGS